jgi:hypothetical protein
VRVVRRLSQVFLSTIKVGEPRVGSLYSREVAGDSWVKVAQLLMVLGIVGRADR